MVIEKTVRPLTLSTSFKAPPCARTSSCAIARPSPVPPLRTAPRKAEKRFSRALGGRPGPVSRHQDRAHRARALARDGQAAHQRALAVGGHRLHGIAAEIGEHAEELLGIGVDLDRRIDAILEVDRRTGRAPACSPPPRPAGAAGRGGAPAPAPACGRRRARPRNRPPPGRARAAASARRPGRSGPSPAAAGRRISWAEARMLRMS